MERPGSSKTKHLRRRSLTARGETVGRRGSTIRGARTFLGSSHVCTAPADGRADGLEEKAWASRQDAASNNYSPQEELREGRNRKKQAAVSRGSSTSGLSTSLTFQATVRYLPVGARERELAARGKANLRCTVGRFINCGPPGSKASPPASGRSAQAHCRFKLLSIISYHTETKTGALKPSRKRTI